MEFHVYQLEKSPTYWRWALETKDGVICTSDALFRGEEAARSAVAKAKKTMSGARYAKVRVTPA